MFILSMSIFQFPSKNVRRGLPSTTSAMELHSHQAPPVFWCSVPHRVAFPEFKNRQAVGIGTGNASTLQQQYWKPFFHAHSTLKRTREHAHSDAELRAPATAVNHNSKHFMHTAQFVRHYIAFLSCPTYCVFDWGFGAQYGCLRGSPANRRITAGRRTRPVHRNSRASVCSHTYLPLPSAQAPVRQLQAATPGTTDWDHFCVA